MSFFALALALSAQPVLPFDPMDDDVRCLAAISMMGANGNAEVKSQAAIGAMYFIGRIDGRMPGYDLEAAMKRILPTLAGERLGAELRRCGTILMERGEYLQKVGKALSAAGM